MQQHLTERSQNDILTHFDVQIGYYRLHPEDG